nr:hypothetical protein [Chloroflexia bacterium]
MTESAQPSSGAASAPACGNCGVPVQPDAVTCPACGVLLAAYQAPAGASGNETISVADTSATHETASPAMTSTAGPVGTPAKPITPLRHTPRSQSPIGDALRRSRESGTSGAEDLASHDAADELARMATSDSPLARAVEAELAGAKVTFDGDAAVIETDRVDLTHTPEGAPVVVSHAPAIPVSPPRPQPVRSSSGVAPVVPAGDQRPASGGHDPARVVR